MTASPAARPSKTTTAILLLYVSLGLGILRSLWALPAFAPMEGQGQAGGAMAIAAIVYALMFLFIFMTGKGRNWARVTFLALYLVGMAMLAAGLTSGAPGGGGVALDLAQALIQLAALILLFMPESNAWFRGMKAARARKKT